MSALSTAGQPKKRNKLGNATYLGKTLDCHPSQLDYILVSSRWKSSFASKGVRWQPSRRRFGFKFDHGMVSGEMRMRVGGRRKQAGGAQKWAGLQSKATAAAFDAEYERVRALRPAVVPECWEELDQKEAELVAGRLHEQIGQMAEEAAKVLPESKRAERGRGVFSPETDALFREREQALANLDRGGPRWRAERQLWRNRIVHACRRDRRAWAEGIACEMEAAADRGDSAAVWQGVRRLAHKPWVEPAQPTKTRDGADLESAEQLASEWRGYACEKFACTEAELLREWSALGCASGRSGDVPAAADLDMCLRALRAARAVGPDGLPAELFQKSAQARRDLFKLVTLCWQREVIPESLIEGTFVTIFKQKGSKDDYSKHRFICLLNHAYKLLSSYLLLRTLREIDPEFLPDTQAGFRKGRATRDNMYVLQLLIKFALTDDKPLVLTFVDFSAAFDSVSHKYLDDALEEAGASDKVRAVFRAVYGAATARVRVRGPEGCVLSSAFPVRRGVVQGDIFSPVCFILALEGVFRGMKLSGEAGVRLGLGQLLRKLEYADDAALPTGSTQEASEAVTELARAATALADMSVNVSKTEYMVVGRYDGGGQVEECEYDERVWAHACEGCGRGFPTRHGLHVHEGRWCKQLRTEEYEVERIVDVRGEPHERFFRVRWKGFRARDDSWLNWRHCLKCSNLLDEFWSGPGARWDRERAIWVSGEAGRRCRQCCRLFKTAAALKGHHTKHQCAWRVASRVGSRAEQAVKCDRMAAAHAAQEGVRLGEVPLVAAFSFRYLGGKFRADGDQQQALEYRMALAADKFRVLRRVWNSSELSLELKLRVYAAGVVSVLTYGCECWDMERACTAVGAWNARRLAAITDRQIRDEYLVPSYDLLGEVRARRLKYVGHILRLEEGRLLRVAIEEEWGRQADSCRGLLYDTPRVDSFSELVLIASDSDLWRRLVEKVYKKKPKRKRKGIVEVN